MQAFFVCTLVDVQFAWIGSKGGSREAYWA